MSRIIVDIYTLIVKGYNIDDIMIFPGNDDTDSFAVEYVDFAMTKLLFPWTLQVDKRYITFKEWIDGQRNDR